MQVYLTCASETVNQIRSMGDTIEVKKVVLKVSWSLLKKYDYIVAAIEESKDLSMYSFSELVSSLQVHEERINKSSNQPLAFESKVNISNNKNSRSQRGRGRSFQGRGGSYQGIWQRSQWRNYDQQNGESGNTSSSCRICMKSSHVAADCWFKCKKCKNPNHSVTPS